MPGKKVVVILSNESFMPRGGHGGHAYAESKQVWSNDDKPKYAPSSWQPTITTTHAPTAKPTAEEFGEMHRPTGVDIHEVGHLWFELAKKEGWDMTFCTPRGGAIAMDPASIKQMKDDFADKLWGDCSLMAKLNHTYPCSWINPSEYELAIIPGSHAAMIDLPESKSAEKLIEGIYAHGQCVAAIGHGVAALLNCHDTSSSSKRSEYMLHGKRVACFTREEEQKTPMEKYLPFSIEERVKERGGKVVSGKPFESKVVVEEDGDHCLITAQSYPSIHDFIEAIKKHCK